MTRTSRPARVLILFAFLVATAFAFGQEKSAPRTAPGFDLQDLTGKRLRLSDYRGKVVLLDFWATWCAPCQTEVPRFVAFQNEYGKNGFQVIGISMDDTPEPVRKFYTKLKMNYPVAMGTEKLADDYGGVLGLPLTFLIGPNGQIVTRYDGSADLNQMELDIKKLLDEKGESE